MASASPPPCCSKLARTNGVSIAPGETETTRILEIWRPSRGERRGARKGRSGSKPFKAKAGDPAKRPNRGKRPDRKKPVAKDRPAKIDPNSPFAALAKLKETMKDTSN